MRSTARWALIVPSAGTDPDDIPTHLGNFGDQIELLLGAQGGTLAARPVSTVGSPGIIGRLYYVTSGASIGLFYRDNGTGWDLLNVPVGLVAAVTTQGFGDTPAIGNASAGYAPADHAHGTPTNPIIPHLAASNPHPQYSQFFNFNIPFHIANTVTTGLKVPKWIATQNCTIRAARAVLDSGSGSIFQIYVNGAAPTGMTNSPAIGTAPVLHDFTDVNLVPGDRVQVNVITAGTTPADLSITVDGVWR